MLRRTPSLSPILLIRSLFSLNTLLHFISWSFYLFIFFFFCNTPHKYYFFISLILHYVNSFLFCIFVSVIFREWMFRENKRKKERFSTQYCNEKNLSELISKNVFDCINHLLLITEINYHEPNQEKKDLIPVYC